MYAMKIVPLKGEEHEDSSGAEAETLAPCGRRVWRYSAHYFVGPFVWKILSCHDFFRQQPSFKFLLVRIRPFSHVF